MISNRFEITSKNGYQHDFVMLIMSYLNEKYVFVSILGRNTLLTFRFSQ